MLSAASLLLIPMPLAIAGGRAAAAAGAARHLSRGGLHVRLSARRWPIFSTTASCGSPARAMRCWSRWSSRQSRSCLGALVLGERLAATAPSRGFGLIALGLLILDGRVHRQNGSSFQVQGHRGRAKPGADATREETRPCACIYDTPQGLAGGAPEKHLLVLRHVGAWQDHGSANAAAGRGRAGSTTPSTTASARPIWANTLPTT